MVEFAKFSLKLFDDVVLGNKAYVDLILSDAFTHETYYMGLVDENNQVNFYDGKVRVVDPDGEEFVKFEGSEYLEHIAEHVEPYSYLKFPYLKSVGWKGFVDGKDSGVYRASPLAASTRPTAWRRRWPRPSTSACTRRSAASRCTPRWRRTGRAWSSCSTRPSGRSSWPPTRRSPTPTSAPSRPASSARAWASSRRRAARSTTTTRPTSKGIVTKANLIVGTTNNNAAISHVDQEGRRRAHQGRHEIGEGLLNMVEMAFRAYDPCFGCATHTLPGEMPLEVSRQERGHARRHHQRQAQHVR